MNALARIQHTPAAICAEIELAGRHTGDAHQNAIAASQTQRKQASSQAQPTQQSPASAPFVVLLNPATGLPIVDGHGKSENQIDASIDNTHPAANDHAQPVAASPQESFPRTSSTHHDAILTIQDFYRLRVDMIRARTKLILQAQASLRRMFDGDKEKAAKAYGEAAKDETHIYRPMLAPYLTSLDVLDDQQRQYEKEMVRALKGLPILDWARGIKGFGDLSLANIIGECSGFAVQDIIDRHGVLITKAGDFYSVGDFKSVSAVWKRMGVAVIDGRRQGAPGKGATADDWIAEAYSKSRRSVLWNIGNSLILSMGKFRPMFGEDIDANPDYTELQKVFANRARYEAERLPHKDGSPIKESAKGKDSYTLHAANRAKRYTEKRLIRMLFSEWRRSMT